MQLRVFIGSSGEAQPSMELLAAWVEELGHLPIPWDEPEVFPVGGYTFQSLQDVAASVDASISIFAEDDKISHQGQQMTTTRDNVLVEYGLFAGVLGGDRVAFCRVGNPKPQTDLLGITYVDLTGKAQAKLRLKAWLNAVVKLEEKTNKQKPGEEPKSDIASLDYQEMRPSRESLINMLSSAEEFIEWYTLNFGNVRITGAWKTIGSLLNNRIRSGVRVRILTLHPAAYLPLHVEIAHLKNPGTGPYPIQDVRKRCVRGVRDLHDLAKRVNTGERSPSFEIKCTRAIPRFGLVATEKCLKLEFYPADWQVATTDRCTVTIREPSYDVRNSCWIRDFRDLWHNRANLKQDRWLQGFKT